VLHFPSGQTGLNHPLWLPVPFRIALPLKRRDFQRKRPVALNGASTRPPIIEPLEPPRRPDYSRFVLLLLAFGLALFLILQPGVRAKLLKLLPAGPKFQMNSGVVVWAGKQSGSYYCPGSALYAKGLGSYMRQGDALTVGYQPALGRYCDSVESKYSKGVTTIANPSDR
jgi:hypothetical protein